MRLTSEDLEKIKIKYNVDTLYSWSRLSCFTTSKYEYYLKYILHKTPDRDNSIYGAMGGVAHQCIEDFYSGKINYKQMYESFIDGWTVCLEVCDLKFDRNNEDKNEEIKRKYKEDLEHFFKHHIKIEDQILLEKFLVTKVDEYALQGYADAIVQTKDKDIVIIDWKTSTKFSKQSLEEHSGQLVIYALALIQRGVPINKIKICFCFLKYTNVEIEQANGKKKLRQIERSKLGESLQANVSMWLNKNLQYKENADDYLKALIDTNDINVLPEDIRAKYTISDCYVYVDLTEKLIGKWEKYIVDTIADIKAREKDYEYNKSIGIDEESCGKIFWDSEEDVEKNSYYYSTLCGYSPNLLLPYKQYLEKLEAKKNENVFTGVGTQVESEDLIDFSELFKD